MKTESAITTAAWIAGAASVAGAKHMESNLPCQDACAARTTPRPHLLVCDGRGSARLSDQGASKAVQAVEKAMLGLAPLLELALDVEISSQEAASRWALVAQVLVTTMGAEQWALARDSGEPSREYEFTAALAVVGNQHTGWLQIGDSQLVAVRHGVAAVLDVPEEFEFANQTRFVRATPRPGAEPAGGVFPTTGTDAIFAFSDGVTPRVLSNGRSLPTPLFCELAVCAAGDPENFPRTLASLLLHEDWHLCTRDDRSLAGLVANIPFAPGPLAWTPAPPRVAMQMVAPPGRPLPLCPNVPLDAVNSRYPAAWEVATWWIAAGVAHVVPLLWCLLY